MMDGQCRRKRMVLVGLVTFAQEPGDTAHGICRLRNTWVGRGFHPNRQAVVRSALPFANALH